MKKAYKCKNQKKEMFTLLNHNQYMVLLHDKCVVCGLIFFVMNAEILPETILLMLCNWLHLHQTYCASQFIYKEYLLEIVVGSLRDCLGTLKNHSLLHAYKISHFWYPLYTNHKILKLDR